MAGINQKDIEAGRSVYNFRCYFCHGYSGDARTLAAEFLSPPPRDFTDTDPEALRSARAHAELNRVSLHLVLDRLSGGTSR